MSRRANENGGERPETPVRRGARGFGSPSRRGGAIIAALCIMIAAALSGCRGEGEAAREDLDRALRTHQRDPVTPRLRTIAAAALPPAQLETTTLSALTIDQAMRETLASLERVRFAGEDIYRAEILRVLAASELLPNVNWRYTYFKQEDDFSVPPGVRFGGLLTENRTSRFELRQPLLHAEDIMAFGASGPVVEAAEARARDEARGARLAAIRAFFAVLVAERAAETFIAALERDDERLREVRARLQVGVVRRTEVLFIETDRARTQASLDRARRDIASARARLGLLIGRPLRGPLVAPPDVTHDPPPLASVIEEAFESRPDLAALRREMDSRQWAVYSAYGAYFPGADFTGNLYTHREGNLEKVDWDFTIDVSVPIFSGFAISARLAEAETLLRQARLTYEAQARFIAEEVATLYHSRLASTAALNSREAEVSSATENYRLLEAEYRVGLASNLELVTAEEQLRLARLDLEVERLNERRLAIELDLATGWEK
jgi:outer membrane protein TolC